MESYKIKLTKYSEAGALTTETTIMYANNVEEARNICDEYGKQRYEGENGSVGTKIWKVELLVLCYKLITDKDAFFALFEG